MPSRSRCLRLPSGLARPLRTLLFLLLGLALGGAFSGCRTLEGPSSASFASVVIRGHSEEEISAAAAKVFGEDGYTGAPAAGGSMVFEKEASRARTLARAGAIDTYYGARTINRVRAELVPLADGAFRLQCQAYTVSGTGDPFFDDEVALTNLRSAPYRALLERAADALK